jgi:hypothetical protein
MSIKDPYGIKRQCISCDKFGTESNPVIYTSNPYYVEIFNDYSHDWYCNECLDDFAGDI